MTMMATTTKPRSRRCAVPSPLVLFAVAAAALFFASPAAASKSGSCLCLFDQDRTLTGRQGAGGTSTCPADKSFSNIVDPAYKNAGPLTLSDLALRLRQTWCGQHCYLGIITAAKMTGPPDDEHKLVARQVSGDNGNLKMPPANKLTWAHAKGTTPAPLLHSAEATAKYKAVPLIVAYYKQTLGVTIPDSKVYMFDDIQENIAPWKKNSPYSAFQISCKTRDYDPIEKRAYGIGKCGATVDEINNLANTQGCQLCKGSC